MVNKRKKLEELNDDPHWLLVETAHPIQQF